MYTPCTFNYSLTLIKEDTRLIFYNGTYFLDEEVIGKSYVINFNVRLDAYELKGDYDLVEFTTLGDLPRDDGEPISPVFLFTEGVSVNITRIHFTRLRRTLFGYSSEKVSLSSEISMGQEESTLSFNSCSITRNYVNLFQNETLLHLSKMNIIGTNISENDYGMVLWNQISLVISINNTRSVDNSQGIEIFCKDDVLVTIEGSHFERTGGSALYFDINGDVELKLIDSSFIENHALFIGGACFISARAIDLTVENCVVSRCFAPAKGGGFEISGKSLSLRVSDSVFENNTAWYSGGGINVNTDSYVATIERSSFRRCVSAQSGGAVSVSSIGIEMDVNEVDFEDNLAATFGAGILLFSERVIFSVRDSTFVANQAEIGGGFYIRAGGEMQVSAVSSNFTDNYADTNAGFRVEHTSGLISHSWDPGVVKFVQVESCYFDNNRIRRKNKIVSQVESLPVGCFSVMYFVRSMEIDYVTKAAGHCQDCILNDFHNNDADEEVKDSIIVMNSYFRGEGALVNISVVFAGVAIIDNVFESETEEVSQMMRVDLWGKGGVGCGLRMMHNEWYSKEPFESDFGDSHIVIKLVRFVNITIKGEKFVNTLLDVNSRYYSIYELYIDSCTFIGSEFFLRYSEFVSSSIVNVKNTFFKEGSWLRLEDRMLNLRMFNASFLNSHGLSIRLFQTVAITNSIFLNGTKPRYRDNGCGGAIFLRFPSQEIMPSGGSFSMHNVNAVGNQALKGGFICVVGDNSPFSMEMDANSLIMDNSAEYGASFYFDLDDLNNFVINADVRDNTYTKKDGGELYYVFQDRHIVKPNFREVTRKQFPRMKNIDYQTSPYTFSIREKSVRCKFHRWDYRVYFCFLLLDVEDLHGVNTRSFPSDFRFLVRRISVLRANVSAYVPFGFNDKNHHHKGKFKQHVPLTVKLVFLEELSTKETRILKKKDVFLEMRVRIHHAPHFATQS